MKRVKFWDRKGWKSTMWWKSLPHGIISLLTSFQKYDTIYVYLNEHSCVTNLHHYNDWKELLWKVEIFLLCLITAAIW